LLRLNPVLQKSLHQIRKVCAIILLTQNKACLFMAFFFQKNTVLTLPRLNFSEHAWALPADSPMKVLQTQEVTAYTSSLGGEEGHVRQRRVTPARLAVPAPPEGQRYQAPQ
jgi:hypothetical protein